jgi:cytochrome c556
MKNRVKVVISAGVLSVALGLSAVSAHSMSTGIESADKRIGMMKELGQNMKAIAGVAKGEMAYSPELNAKAARVDAIADALPDLFPEGSGGPKTRSKDEIWSDKAGFTKALAEFKAATTNLVAAVETGDQGKIGAALGATGKTCGGCHKPFRAPEH